ncbi:uncharacterized protein LOC118285967 isoform X5 [Scophthalmus maximus]|uniref:uncharacterized protein LOC118285967 isoform X5 n=1 Tax=Scophthalmus maximus TaxID=52904 RepID=UPI0015E154CE|nr:uncharacterized protein LOC118285967 isoform X5 [Scophthalmus maximus]
MNWVGGSRSRLVTKDDAKKQREFFEKRKMQKKLKNLGLALPASPGGAGAAATGSVDLVTLFIVNQIATKKENKDLPKVAVLGSGRRGSNRQNNPLVLPMSPCSPSQLSLVESQPQYSVHGMTKSRHVIPQGFRCQQLSPVLESPFSDNSASDYPPPTFARLSPFSSMSSASSCQGGVFPLKLSRRQLPPRCSPPPWVTSGMRHVQFQPFSQPRGMTDNLPWSCGSDPALYQQETPTAAQVLFGSPEPDVSDVRVRDVSFSLDQTEDKESALDFTLHQSDAEQHFEEDVFRGFSNEDDEKEAFHFGSARSKIYLRDGTPVKSSAPHSPTAVTKTSHILDTTVATWKTAGIHRVTPVRDVTSAQTQTMKKNTARHASRLLHLHTRSKPVAHMPRTRAQRGSQNTGLSPHT